MIFFHFKDRKIIFKKSLSKNSPFMSLIFRVGCLFLIEVFPYRSFVNIETHLSISSNLTTTNVCPSISQSVNQWVNNLKNYLKINHTIKLSLESIINCHSLMTINTHWQKSILIDDNQLSLMTINTHIQWF